MGITNTINGCPYYWVSCESNPDEGDYSPQFLELEQWPEDVGTIDDVLRSASDSKPLRFRHVEGSLPDFPSSSPILRICSGALKDLMDEYLNPEDNARWLPLDAINISDESMQRMFVLEFENPPEIRWQPWLRRLFHKPIFPPFILNRNALNGKSIASFDPFIWLVMHERVCQDIIDRKLNKNMTFRPARWR